MIHEQEASDLATSKSGLRVTDPKNDDPHSGTRHPHHLLQAVCSALIFVFTTSCAHRLSTIPRAEISELRNDSFFDLTAGGQLRIVMPVIKPGTSSVVTGSQKQEGNTLVLSAANLLGYSSSYYAIESHGRGKVQLRFSSAEVTEEGTSKSESNPPGLPFALPQKGGYIRLIYLLRSSQTDHNMAIVAVAKRELLQPFTEQMQADPSRCIPTKHVFCSWVPLGIAVRPESAQPSN